MELYALGFAGVAIHYLKDWVKANNAGKTYDLKKSLPTAILSVITTLILVYLREDIKPIFVVTPLSAVMIGYTGNSLFFSIVDSKKPKIEKDEVAG